MESRAEMRPRPQGSVAERIRKKSTWMERTFRPASSASEEAFRLIIAVLPPGDMKRSMETVLPQLKDLLKTQDRELVIGTFLQRAISSVVFGVWGGIGGAFLDPTMTGIGPAIGAATGVGTAFAIPSASQTERARIAVAAKQQEMMLRTSGGREAAKVFDSKRVDQITQAILWGTGAQGGAGGVLGQAANPMT